MPLTSGFLENYRAAGRPTVELERVLAVGRAFLAVSALIAIYMDPTEPTRFRAVTYTVLVLYALHSLVVLVYVHRSGRLTLVQGRVLRGVDIASTSVLTFVSSGPVSPFFLFFLFVVVAAAYRGGFLETAGTAAITVAVFLVETAIAAGGPWSATWFASFEVQQNTIILRVAYLLLTGVLLGYLAEQDKQSRAELAAIADVTRQPRVTSGVGGSVTAVARLLSSMFGASSIGVVIDDQQNHRTLLWHLHRAQGGAADDSPVRRLDLTEEQKAAWLFNDFGSAWQVIRQRNSDASDAWATEPGQWPLRRFRAELPRNFRALHSFHSVTAVNMGLPGEWHGRIYLFDASKVATPERTLHFLEALTDHVAPALTNVFLLRRLRARAGAAERARVARELHDGAIQSLFGIEMKLEAFRRGADRSPAFVDAEVGAVQELLRREVLSLRELMQALRPVELEGPDQLAGELAGVVERFRRDTGISARCVVTGGDIGLPPRKALEVVRIVQEALANVRRHAHAQNVLVSLTSHDGECRLVIEDDGRGFDFEGRLSGRELEQRRIGPAVIKERARLAGARLVVDSTPGAGARVEVSFAEETQHA